MLTLLYHSMLTVGKRRRENVSWFSFLTVFLFREIMSSEAWNTGNLQDDGRQSSLFCGGILNDFVSLPTNDTDIATVAKFGTDYASQRHPNSFQFADDGEIVPWTVEEAKKMKLQFTKDGLHPITFQDISEGPKGAQIHQRQAILGIIYAFTLAWPSIPNSFRHTFVINKDREKKLYVYSHCFYRPSFDGMAEPGRDLHPLGAGMETLGMRATEPLLASKGSCIDQSDCSSENIAMAARALDQSGSKSTAHSQSECSGDRSHNMWTEDDSGHNVNTGRGCNGNNVMFGRFLTYNIWNFNTMPQKEPKLYPKRLKQMGELLVTSGSDIIGMQEVRYDYSFSPISGPSQVAQLADHLHGYQFVYQPASTYWQGHLGRVEEGLVIFSRHPILSHDYILLPRNESDPEEGPHQRICLHAEIEHPSLGIVHVFVSHLSLSSMVRDRSVVEIWRFMQRYQGLAVLMGDLNAEPQETSMRFLRGEVELLGHQTEGLVDAWRALHEEPRPDAPRTYRQDEPRDPGLTFSTLEQHLRKRIDYVYIRLTDDTKLLDISIVDDGLRGRQAASDHVGVAAVIAPAAPL